MPRAAPRPVLPARVRAPAVPMFLQPLRAAFRDHPERTHARITAAAASRRRRAPQPHDARVVGVASQERARRGHAAERLAPPPAAGAHAQHRFGIRAVEPHDHRVVRAPRRSAHPHLKAAPQQLREPPPPFARGGGVRCRGALGARVPVARRARDDGRPVVLGFLTVPPRAAAAPGRSHAMRCAPSVRRDRDVPYRRIKFQKLKRTRRTTAPHHIP